MRGRLLILCGIPGSGKTTIGALVARHLIRAAHLQTDAIRAAIASPNYSSRESRFVYRALIAAGREALRADYDTILDGTFPREEFRREALVLLRSYYQCALVVVVWCDPSIAYARNLKRANPVPEESFFRLYRQFEFPFNALRIETDTASPEEAAMLVLDSLTQGC